MPCGLDGMSISTGHSTEQAWNGSALYQAIQARQATGKILKEKHQQWFPAGLAWCLNIPGLCSISVRPGSVPVQSGADFQVIRPNPAGTGKSGHHTGLFLNILDTALNWMAWKSEYFRPNLDRPGFADAWFWMFC